MVNKLRIPEGDLNLLKMLQRYGIPFVIIGGHAVRFHGVERGVDDLDVLVDSAGRAEEMMAAISEAVGSASGIDIAELGEPYRQIRLKNSILYSEILTGAYGVEFAEVYQDAHVVEVEGVTLRVILKERLIRNNRATGREKDLQDVEHLEALEADSTL